jgi:hypothetical protein
MTKWAELMSNPWQDYFVIVENYSTYPGAGIS